MRTTSDKHKKGHFFVTDCVLKTCKTLKATFVFFVKLLTHFWAYSKIKEPLESRLDFRMCVHAKRRALWSFWLKWMRFLLYVADLLYVWNLWFPSCVFIPYFFSWWMWLRWSLPPHHFVTHTDLQFNFWKEKHQFKNKSWWVSVREY